MHTSVQQEAVKQGRSGLLGFFKHVTDPTDVGREIRLDNRRETVESSAAK